MAMNKKSSFCPEASRGEEDLLWDSGDDDLILCEAMVKNTAPTPSHTGHAPLHKGASLSKSSKKSSSWISSSFGGFEEFGQSSCPVKESVGRSRKRPREFASTKVQPSSIHARKNKLVKDELWMDKYAPRTQADLAVHKKKVAEVQSWIETSLLRKKSGSMCLLTGPAGVGKTSTVRALASDLKLEVQEWTNPVTTSSTQWTEDFQPSRPELATLGGSWSESQTTQFKDFLLRADRYPTLQLTSSHREEQKIILIEEFPNVFSRNVTQFHDILRQHQRSGGCPLVFIVSDTATRESYERLLFPKDSQVALGIHNINFNPVATTMMVKVLQRIASTEAIQCGSRYQVPSKPVLEALTAASAGDLRSAVNTLQFAALKGCGDVSAAVKGGQQLGTKGKSSSRSKSASLSSKVGSWKWSQKGKRGQQSETSDTELAAIGGRDTSLFLFRALGKILYCKHGSYNQSFLPSHRKKDRRKQLMRREGGEVKDAPDYVRMPPHLAHHNRDPMLITPEEVIEKSHLSGDYFTAYLHQNYLGFFTELDDVVRASDYLSSSDYLTANWENRPALCGYAACIASRGIMHANTGRARASGAGPSGLGWKPLHKPQWYGTMKKKRENCAAAHGLFRGHGHSWTPEELQTQLLPYLYLTNVTVNHPAQISFLQEVCRFSQPRSQMRSGDKLDEKDFALQETDEDADVTGQKGSFRSGLPGATQPTQTDTPPSSQDTLSALPPGGGSDNSDDNDFTIEDFDD